MDKSTLHPAIEHLSDAEIETVIELYIAGEKKTELIDRYKIKCAPNRLRLVLPPRVLEETCSICGGAMIQELLSDGYDGPYWIRCVACRHRNNDECGCSHCVEIRARQAKEEELNRQVDIMERVIDRREKHPRLIDSVHGLSLSLAVAFLAFSRCSQVDGDGLYTPLDESPMPFAPKDAYEMVLLDSLCKVGLISLSEYSTPGTISCEDSKLTYEIESVHWSGDIEENIKLAKQIEECALDGNWPDGWAQEVEAVWLELAVAECREFYKWCRSERDLPGEDEQLVTRMLENILRDFSVGQCYRIIWQGRERAESLARKKGIEAFQMARSCQLWADQARAEGYSVTALKRHRPPQHDQPCAIRRHPQDR